MPIKKHRIAGYKLRDEAPAPSGAMNRTAWAAAVAKGERNAGAANPKPTGQRK